MKKKLCISCSELKRRGWTDGLIKKFLPTPDDTKTNPIFKCAAPMKLYKIKRVVKIEKSEQFIKEMEAISIRKNAAKKAVETKTAKTLEKANSVNFNVPTFSKDKLERNAIYHYEQYNDTKVYDRDNEDFINRICTNYLRHECTNYDRILDSLYGLVGRQKAYEIIKGRINQEIKEKHNWIQ